MKKFMKSIVCALVMMCTCVGAQAQDAENAIGVNFGYMVGNSGVSNPGIGIKYDRFLSENLRLEANGMYYFKMKSNQTEWFDANINAHYLFNISDQFKFFPIFGFTTMWGKTSFKDGEKVPSFVTEDQYDGNGDYSDRHFRFGCNLGAGVQYNITDDFGLTLEAKYKLVTQSNKFGNFNIALGCVVLF